MGVFPIFIELKNKKCVVVGGGTVAQRKIEKLLEFDAKITVISIQINEKIERFKEQQLIAVRIGEYNNEDLDEAFLVIACTNDTKTNEKVYEDALKRKIFVNIADCPQKCTFLFPSIVKRGDMTIGISTSGSYPALSKAVRQKIEQLFPENFGLILNVLKVYRIKAMKKITSQKNRAKFLNEALTGVLDEKSISLEQLEKKIEKIFREYGDTGGSV